MVNITSPSSQTKFVYIKIYASINFRSHLVLASEAGAWSTCPHLQVIHKFSYTTNLTLRRAHHFKMRRTFSMFSQFSFAESFTFSWKSSMLANRIEVHSKHIFCAFACNRALPRLENLSFCYVDRNILATRTEATRSREIQKNIHMYNNPF